MSLFSTYLDQTPPTPKPPRTATPEERLAWWVGNRFRCVGMTTYRYQFRFDGEARAVPETKAPPVPTEVPTWATPGASVTVPGNPPEYRSPYRVIATGPIVCLLETQSGEDNPLDTETFARYWGPA